MAIIYSYPTVIPTNDDLLLGTDTGKSGNPTKNFTIKSIADLLVGTASGLGATLTQSNDARIVNADGSFGANQSAINFANLQGTGSVSFSSFSTVGGIQISGTIGLGFTAFTSTIITGTLQTPSQTNITSLGTLTSLKIGNATPAVTSIKTTMVSPGSDLALVTEKAIAAYIATKPNPETLAETLANGNTTGGTDIAVSAADDITFTDTSKALFGASNDLQIFHDASNSIVAAAGTGNLNISTNSGSVQINKSNSETMAEFAVDGAVDLYYNGIKKFETTDAGVSVVGAIISTGVSEVPDGTVAAPSYSFANDTNTGMFRPSANKVGIAGGGVLGLTVDATDTVVQGALTVNGAFTAVDTAQASFGGKVTVSTPTATTDAANKEYVDTQSDAKTLSYKDATATTYQMNLFGDTLQLAGGTNITSAALAVAANKAVVTFNLDNSIVLSGQVKADNFTTTAGTATWATTVLAGFTSITSTSFVGALTGNATTATALATPGTIQLTSGSGLTQGVASNAITYTDGGNISLTTSLANTTVTAKTLLNLPGFTSASITAGDTILAALAKLQGQITGIPQGLVYKGLWNALTNSPTLASGVGVTGQFYIVSVAGTTNLDGITDWQVGDWAIFVEVGATDTWQKLDNSQSITGSGATNKITKWTAPTVLGTGLIEDDGTTVTIGANGNLTVLGDTILGDDAAADTITLNGPTTFQSTGIFKVGIGLGGAVYGSAGQVLTSGGGSGNVNTWTSPTVGTLTSVGLTETGNALTITNSPITTSGNINIAGAGNSTQYINGALDLVAFPTVDNYNYWALVGDTGAAQLISSTDTATFAGGFGISTVTSAAGILTTAIDITGADNAIAGLTAATAVETDTLWFNDISDGNTIRKSTLANLPFSSTLSGTQYTIPMFATTSTLGDSMITQNAGGTAATISGTLTTTGSLTSTLGTFSDKVIISASQNPVLTLRRTNGNPSIAFGGITGNTAAGEIQVIGSGSSFGSYYFYSQSGTLASPNYLLNMSLKVDSASDTVMEIGKGSGNKGTIACQGSIIVDIDKNNSATGKFFLIGTHINGGSGTELLKVKDDGIVQMPDYGSGTNTGTEAYNLAVDSSGNIIETLPTGGGGGGGIAKGGTFTKLYTTGNAGVAGVAFTIDRAVSGSMVFDVMLTSDNSNTVTIAKKFTVVNQYGTTAPIFNKILDSGPDGSNDFTVAFETDGTSQTKIKCTITPVGMNTQKIGITLDLGFGQNDATVVMN